MLRAKRMIVICALALCACDESANNSNTDSGATTTLPSCKTSGQFEGGGGAACRDPGDCTQPNDTCVGVDEVYSGVFCGYDDCNYAGCPDGAACVGYCGECKPMVDRCDAPGADPCAQNTDCSPTATGRDVRGCVRRGCSDDSACDCGACVNGLCQSRLGGCGPPAA
ncbi:MAG: hypothetical protein KC503_02285 [Myxococcales bacterium]|nr:hypothetical protein [Myxococcales bacterium]